MDFRHVLAIIAVSFALIASHLDNAEAARFANGEFLVQTEWLSEHLNDPGIRILDARRPADYEQGHIPNAIHPDRKEITAIVNGVRGMLAPVKEVERILGLKGIDNQSRVVIYDNTTGTSAARVFWILDYLGHKNMSVLNGGWAKWIREGRGITRKTPEMEDRIYKANPNPFKLVTGTWILKNLHKPDMVILDVRSRGEFTGELARSARGGHIPGIHLEWKNNLTREGTIKEAKELRNMYYKAQVKKGKLIVVYCQSGRRAAQTYFVLRLLGN
ncbi:MAG: sulfurtransferase [Deltaproteobacteria bacterium]|nr:sulfurtransferase [Deltaproteobacteria bacterium]